VREPAEPDRVLATVLFTDIVGSTERALELTDRGSQELKGIPGKWRLFALT
jgi:class 3 adenylate cyclase